MKPLYLIDFSNWQYKFSSVYTLTSNISGVDVSVSVPFGFIRSLKSLVYSDVIIVLDGVPRMFSTWLPQYKGQRVKEPNESINFPRSELIKMLTVIGEKIGKNVKVVCAPGQEADQAISSICHLVKYKQTKQWERLSMFNDMMYPIEDDFLLARYKDGLTLSNINVDKFDSVIIGTTDSDMHQLKSLGNVMLDSSTSGKMLSFYNDTPAAVYHLPPHCIGAFKAIVGDVSDNIPKLQIPYKVDELVSIIREEFNSMEDTMKFIQGISKFDNQFTPALNLLASKIIESGQVKTLLNNYKITTLEFYSIPKQMSYLDYDINTTLSKYKLKV